MSAVDRVNGAVEPAAPRARTLDDLSQEARAALFARFSDLSYLPAAEAAPQFTTDGFYAELLDDGHNAAYVLRGGRDVVLVFRGTVPTDSKNVKEDLKALLVLSRIGVGHKHQGFQEALDCLWTDLSIRLRALEQGKRLWLTGHSLGGAMATIAAFRCRHESALPDPAGLVTFGSPRVGNRRYVNSPVGLTVPHQRFINCIDMMPALPSWWLGFRHHGQTFYFNHFGNLRRLTLWQRVKDKARALLAGLRSTRLGPLDCHAIARYREHTARLASGIEYPQSLTDGTSGGGPPPASPRAT